MKETIRWLLIVSVGIAMFFGVVYLTRTASNAATPITVSEIKPGVYCALAATEQGVGIDCWMDGEME